MKERPRETRGKLTPRTRPEDFRDFYWLKLELQAFCRAHGLSTSGGKPAIADRIEHFLRTGERLRPTTAATRRSDGPPASRLSLRTKAPAGFRCTQDIRAFFERQLGKRFRFTVTLQAFIKENPGVSFGEIAAEWTRQEELKRSGAWRPAIASQFELNQFTRDYHSDPRNVGKTAQDCRDAWHRTRSRRGDKKYRPGA